MKPFPTPSVDVELMGEISLSELEPDAYWGLPEAYRADSCLEFWRDKDTLFCRPKYSQIPILGFWVACWDDCLGWVEWGTVI